MSVFAIVGLVLGALAAVGAAWKVLKPAFLAVRRISHFFDDWFGEQARPGVPERPGVMARLEQMQVDLDKVKHEMWPNSGGSLRDAVDRLEKATNSDGRT
ncbi:hypothetical protein ABZ342_44580 [Amycolatopsis sp. NPDC005961]|uniref:hypothetical protein n=1 Tax=Amycolatopsis sp. NPDC005961 TaxID=3156720 RepID=UPI00340F930C